LRRALKAQIIERLGDRRDEAARLVQQIGLSAAARIARRALGAQDGEPAQEALCALMGRLCRYEHVSGQPDLPEPAECGALEATLQYIAQLPPETQQQLDDVLWVFEAGAAALGPERAQRRFSAMSGAAQDVYITRWEQSELLPMRAAFLGLKSACMIGYWSRPQVWPAIDYTLNPHPQGAMR
jgi:hypothetical protein